MAKTDDRQWFKNPSVTDPEEIVAKQVVTRALAEHLEWIYDDNGPGLYPTSHGAHKPFRVEDQETLIYTDRWGRRFMIEVTAHEVTEDENAQEGAGLLAADPSSPAGQEATG